MDELDERESEITLERMRRLLNQLEATMKDHEQTCGMCSFLIRDDNPGRCGKYQQMRETKWKWGKRYDDTTLAMALRREGNV